MAKAEETRKRVCVLFSGRGSNMASLVMATMAPDYPAIITHAFTNVPGAGGLEIAEFHNIASAVVDHKALLEKIAEAKPDIICLAGYMRVLTAGFVRRFRGKILNIHPSLLPAFKGVDTHHRALLAGVRIHGATVHFVDETLDGGPIVAQAAVAVEPGDTDDTLAERVLEAEHRLYPHALALIASGKVRLSGSRIVTSANAGGAQPALFSPPTGEPKRVL